jgi:hypothetical protein
MLSDVLFSSSHRGCLIVNQTSGVEAFARWSGDGRKEANAIHAAVIIREGG